MPLTLMQICKRETRVHVRSIIAKKMAQPDLRENAGKQAAHILCKTDFFKNAALILTFCALPSEIDTFPIIYAALEKGKHIALPRMRKNESKIDFYHINPAIPLENQLAKHQFGMLEPLENLQKVAISDILHNSLLLVPALAFTKNGSRLGHGKGYYDRFIAHLTEKKITPVLIGMCFSFQIVESVPSEKHDQQVTHILSEQKLAACSV